MANRADQLEKGCKKQLRPRAEKRYHSESQTDTTYLTEAETSALSIRGTFALTDTGAVKTCEALTVDALEDAKVAGRRVRRFQGAGGSSSRAGP